MLQHLRHMFAPLHEDSATSQLTLCDVLRKVQHPEVFSQVQCSCFRKTAVVQEFEGKTEKPRRTSRTACSAVLFFVS